MTIWWCGVLALSAAPVNQAIPIQTRENGDPIRVVCVGDSITAGVGAAKGRSYPEQLQDLLGGDWQVENCGVSGRTLMKSGDYPFWKEGAFQQAHTVKPDVVIIMLGTNDTKPQNWAHKADFENDYHEMVKSFLDLKPSPLVYLCRPVPVPEPGKFGINEVGIKEQIPIIDRLAAEMKLGVIDMHAALDGKPQFLPDRVHPDTNGAGEMAVAAYKVLTGQDPGAVPRPNSLFRSHAVLQRGVKVPVWGTSPAGTKVTVEFAGQKTSTTAPEGKWMVVLNPLKPSAKPQTMKIIQGNATYTLRDILVGDVWLASGQSNMERQLGPRPPQKELVGWREAAAAADFPLIREYKVPLASSKTPQQDAKGVWTVCSPHTAADFSAVGFYFARYLQPKARVPIGIIQSSFGGTIVEAWTSTEGLKEVNIDPALSKATDQRAPASLYNAMIAPLLPSPIRGVIWYQGESNNDNPAAYRDLFPALIDDWRTKWNAPRLPFLFVQIAPHNDMKPELREAQLLTLAKTPGTAMTVITDCGDAGDIHPTNKEPVGLRLSMAARALAYGEKIEFSGPIYQSMTISGDKVALAFSHTGKKLIAKDGPLKGFTIAGEDGNFVLATAEIQGTKVVVSSKDVPSPKAVRYGWANVPDVNLYNSEDLPASPFRTDVN